VSQGHNSGDAEASDDVGLHLDDFTSRNRKLARLEVLCLISGKTVRESHAL